jgi:hypothetical protein
VLSAGEREAKPLSNLLLMLEHEHGETEIVLSAITVIELEHGLHRAQTAEQAQNRREYTAARPHNSVCRSADWRHRAPLAYALGTRNPRHFHMLPNLNVIQL